MLAHRSLIIAVFATLLVVGAFFAFPKTQDPGTADLSQVASSSPSDVASSSISVPASGVKKSPSGVSAPSGVAKSAPARPAVVALSGRVAPELVRPTGFTNIDALDLVSTEPFSLKRFLGERVILLEFWTSSSQNSMHTIPYLNSWYQKYNKDGLLIVAVHTPQFAYERSKSVVDSIVFSRRMYFPVVIDNEASTWSAYGNSVWPHRYLIDLNGRIVYEHKGDGAYEATESKIMELLSARAEAQGKPYSYAPFRVPEGAFVTDTTNTISPETFLGAARNGSLVGGVALKEGMQTFALPETVAKNTVAPFGGWKFTKEYMQNTTEKAGLLYRYQGRNVYATLSADSHMRITVTRDGKPLSVTAAGADIRFERDESVLYAKEARIYEIVKDRSGYGEHTLTLTTQSGGLKAFVLMFE